MTYPTVNYIGNKEKIANWITSLIPTDAKSILDVFCGGCSVGYRAKEQGLIVYANDILKINYFIAQALIENNKEILEKKDIENIFNGTPIKGFMFQNFANQYYFPEECKDLDSIRKNISEKIKNKYKRAMAFALMRRAMIRKMPYSRFTIRWNKIKELRDEDLSYAKYGRKRHYHNQSFRFHFEDNLQEYNSAVFDNKQKNKAYNLDVYDAIKKIDADVIYLDPPYAGTMNDYFEFYGLLDAYIDGKKVHPFKNNFIDKNTIVEQFDKLFSSLGKYKYWMLSYNSRSKPDKEEILKLLSHYSKEVVVHEMPYAYRVTGKEKKKKDIEYLFIVRNTYGK
ncbi:MAG: DNA adenine methylase [Fibrobacter sp.]|nr:DNA adenine methylase [Fibrobacter sp.]